MNRIDIVFESTPRSPALSIPVLDVRDVRYKKDDLRRFILDLCILIFRKLDIRNWEMSILITDDASIKKLNKSWRGKDEATDVISFLQNNMVSTALSEGLIPAGDIAISLETVLRNARDWGSSCEEELKRVIIHGILHLKGMKHPENDYEKGMLKLQETLLSNASSIMPISKRVP